MAHKPIGAAAAILIAAIAAVRNGAITAAMRSATAVVVTAAAVIDGTSCLLSGTKQKEPYLYMTWDNKGSCSRSHYRHVTVLRLDVVASFKTGLRCKAAKRGLLSVRAHCLRAARGVSGDV